MSPTATVVRRRRRLAGLIVTVCCAVAVALLMPILHDAVRNLTLPLQDASIIRQQAREKDLDPALIAGVIFAETKFAPSTSPTGAEGLMQIEPATAEFLAHQSGATSFTLSDLDTPQVNIAYGSYYLRYLLNRYDGNVMLALAAYNGGEANVDSWLAQARATGQPLTIGRIPFPETQAYVQRVLDAMSAYRANYATQLGI